jgi:hypothetical protein
VGPQAYPENVAVTLKGQPGEPQRKIPKSEQDLAETLLAYAVADSPSELEWAYTRVGLDRDYALRADIMLLMVAITRAALHFGFRQIFRIRRTEADCERILLELEQSELSSIVDRSAARDLVRWACKLTSDDDLADFTVSDATTKTYLAVAAASLVYTAGPISNWRTRYRGLGRGVRNVLRVPERLRVPPSDQSGDC